MPARERVHGALLRAGRADRAFAGRLVRHRRPADARRFDTSLAWSSWVGSAPVLERIDEIGMGHIHAHDLALANRFRVGLRLEPGDSAIPMTDVPGAEDKLARARIIHVYDTEVDVDAALTALHSA